MAGMQQMAQGLTSLGQEPKQMMPVMKPGALTKTPASQTTPTYPMGSPRTIRKRQQLV